MWKLFVILVEHQLPPMANDSTLPLFKNDPIVVLLLGIITCGLYLIYWNIKAAEVLNAASGREVISQPIAIFAGCCFPVNMYFYYLAGKECLPRIHERTGELQKDQGTLLMILGLLFPMVAAMIVQGDINKLYK
jgi:hypothetical protein